MQALLTGDRIGWNISVIPDFERIAFQVCQLTDAGLYDVSSDPNR